MTATIDHDMTTSPAYEPPGPGAWTLDVDHQDAPHGLLMQDLFDPNYSAGFHECFTRYGLPLDRLEGRHVNGWFYVHAVPAGVPDKGGTPPPDRILKLLVRLVPELRRRRRTAALAIAERRWLLDARTWATERHEWAGRIEDLLSLELTTLDDAELAEQTRLGLELAGQMARRHFSLVGASLAVGNLLVAGRGWGLTADDIVPVLRGSSPATVASRTPLVDLAAMAADRDDLRSVDDLRALSPAAAALVDGYLLRYGWRPLGADLEASTLAEQPDRLLRLVSAQALAPAAAADDPTPALRARVPVAGRPEFDRLLADARECYESLDDNSGTFSWTMGALRRLLLEVGRRAVLRGEIVDRDDVFEHRSVELLALAAGNAPVPMHELAERRARRAVAALHPPPTVIGGPLVGPPDPSVFPGALGVLTASMGAYLDQKFTAVDLAPASDRTGSLIVDGHEPVSGVAIVVGEAVGRIIVSLDPAELIDRVEPGDILVCAYTTAAHNSIFPMLGGVLTQFGGPLGHTAVMAREFGIPAVVGAGSMPLHLDGLDGRLVVAPTT